MWVILFMAVDIFFGFLSSRGVGLIDHLIPTCIHGDVNLFVLCDNSSRSANNQITPTCPPRFSINRGALQVILDSPFVISSLYCFWF